MKRTKRIKILLLIISVGAIFVVTSGQWARAFSAGFVFGHACNQQILLAAKERVANFFGQVHSEPKYFV